eukprot:TRINITY_DN54338_c0_g1_i1.p1 TRINITY_DN54338_c0_g1~~TRINITY_DN54338_c0_g1_i1.p1  ORF type:complete len:255 (-),score=31.34 TRINITY_DN54338_c0_g1_i1:332-1096(-)
MDSVKHVLIAEFLGTEDVAHWQAVDAATRKAFEITADYNVWMSCAELQFPYLFGDVALYEGTFRQTFLRCHALLLRTNYEMGSILTIDTMEDATLLWHRLRDASLACRAHLGTFGTDGHVLLGDINFGRLAHATEFHFGIEDKPLLAGLPPGMLKIKLFMDGLKLMTCATYCVGFQYPGQPFLQARSVRLLLDVESADQSVAMSCHGVPVALDGSLRSSPFELDSEMASQCYLRSCLCVLTLKDSSPATADVSR